jgi:hypothetical protein
MFCSAAAAAFSCSAVPNYRQLCSKLHQLRLDAAHMSCAWLNDQYLSLQTWHDSPADSGMALVLNNVWWLEVGGSIPGECDMAEVSTCTHQPVLLTQCNLLPFAHAAIVVLESSCSRRLVVLHTGSIPGVCSCCSNS